MDAAPTSTAKRGRDSAAAADDGRTDATKRQRASASASASASAGGGAGGGAGAGGNGGVADVADVADVDMNKAGAALAPAALAELAGGEEGSGEEEKFTFAVPEAWLKLAKQPTQQPVAADVEQNFHAFIAGDATRRAVDSEFGGTLGPLQAAVTTARLELATALKTAAAAGLSAAERDDMGLAGGETVCPRGFGSYFQVDEGALRTAAASLAGGGGGSGASSGDDDEVDVERVMVLVSKATSTGSLSTEVVRQALDAISPTDVCEQVAKLKAKLPKRRETPAPPGGWMRKAFLQLLKGRVYDLTHGSQLDVEFCDGMPMCIMNKYDTLRGGTVPTASAEVMAKVSAFLAARRAYQKRAAKKKVNITRAREHMTTNHDAILDYMLRSGRRAQYFMPRIAGKTQRMFVRVKVRSPKVGVKPTVKWMLATGGGDEAAATQGVNFDAFAAAHDGDAIIDAFRTGLLGVFTSGFETLRTTQVSEPEMYVTVDYAKEPSDGAGSQFSRIHLGGGAAAAGGARTS